MKSEKRTTILLWASAAAATAGAVAVVAIVKWRKGLQETVVANRLRDVQDVLTDCYRKIREIEEHIPDLTPGTSVVAKTGARKGTSTRRAVRTST